MTKFLEPNIFNIEKGDYVLVTIAYPDGLTTEEICEKYMHTGEVTRVYHSNGGALRIEVEGLKEKAGVEFTWLNRVSVIDKCSNSIFIADEKTLDITTFDLRQADNRETVRNFDGTVTPISKGEFEIYSYDSGNSYIVKAEKTGIHAFKVGCTCRDFENRTRICKHIAHVFNTDRRQAERIAA